MLVSFVHRLAYLGHTSDLCQGLVAAGRIDNISLVHGLKIEMAYASKLRCVLGMTLHSSVGHYRLTVTGDLKFHSQLSEPVNVV